MSKGQDKGNEGGNGKRQDNGQVGWNGDGLATQLKDNAEDGLKSGKRTRDEEDKSGEEKGEGKKVRLGEGQEEDHLV